MNPKNRVIMKQLILLLCSFLLSMGLFYSAYRYDNKYSLHTPQPIGGILFFDTDTDSITHLVNGWQYYRGQLLKPEDFTKDPPLPDGYVSIGQYPGLEAGRQDSSPHGSITYRIMLALPDAKASYTLELPEIYSAYRLYIGDKLAAAQGNPEKENYAPKIHSHSVTFEASGNTQIIFAVSDWSWLYSGLVYPPAFGLQEPVNNLLDQKFAWGLTVTVPAFLLGLLQMGLAVVQKNRRTLYSALICIAFAVSVCSLPVHRLLTTGIMPFYNIELLCRYAIYGVAVLLVNHLYEQHSRVRTAACAIAVSFLPLSLGVSFAAPALSFQSMLLFSRTAGIYKTACAVWILYTAFQIGRKEKNRSNHLILLTGACIFASSLIADRVLPYFEPIRFGWFSEIAGFIFVLLISFLMFEESFHIYKERLLLAQQRDMLQVQIRLQKNHYTDLAGQIQEIRLMRHDIRHHYTQLQLLLENGDYEGAKTYVNQVSHNALDMAPLNFCQNYIADVLLRYYYAKAQAANIPFTIHADLPENIGLPDDNLSIVLGNVLENALEANLRLPEEKRSLTLFIALHSANNLIIESRNAFNGELKEKDGKYCSAKETGRIGIGISSLQAIADKYNGNVWIDTKQSKDGHVFIIRVFLITNL